MQRPTSPQTTASLDAAIHPVAPPKTTPSAPAQALAASARRWSWTALRSSPGQESAARGPGAGQFGGFAMGIVVGVLVGLLLALGVALWVTKVPVPFVNKVPQRTAEQDAAEAERNRSWDPNHPLATKPRAAGAAPAASAAATAPAAMPGAGAASMPSAPAVTGGSARDPAAILSGKAATTSPAPTPTQTPALAPVAPPVASAASAPGTEPFVYFVQAGAYTRSEEAEQQRARLTIMGLDAKVTEREQSGRTMYRVRVGPYPQRELAETAKGQIDGAGIESVLVRVQRSN